MRQNSIILLFAFVLAAPSPALAQRRAPNTGMGGIGASIGAALPTESNLENGLELAGNIEDHKVGEVITALAAYPDGSFWTFAIGAKAYFGR